jgi:hypothetical protein
LGSCHSQQAECRLMQVITTHHAVTGGLYTYLDWIRKVPVVCLLAHVEYQSSWW